MKLHCYHINPIDLWAGSLSALDLAKAINGRDCSASQLEETMKDLAEIEKAAHRGFRKIGWDGDIREGPRYFALPGDTCFEFGYVLKQDNNGSTFVASPKPLPWLKEIACFDSFPVVSVKSAWI